MSAVQATDVTVEKKRMHARLRSIQDTIATEAQTAEAARRAHVLLERQHAKVQQELLQERQARQRAEQVMLEMHLRGAPPGAKIKDQKLPGAKVRHTHAVLQFYNLAKPCSRQVSAVNALLRQRRDALECLMLPSKQPVHDQSKPCAEGERVHRWSSGPHPHHVAVMVMRKRTWFGMRNAAASLFTASAHP